MVSLLECLLCVAEFWIALVEKHPIRSLVPTRVEHGGYRHDRWSAEAVCNIIGVTDDFTTHGESHFYGLPCPSTDSLDPMDHFCTFDVSKIIPKNMQKLPYATFKPFLA